MKIFEKKKNRNAQEEMVAADKDEQGNHIHV